MDKNCAEAKTEIKALKTLMKERREEGFSCESDSEDDLGDDPNEKRGSIHPFSAEDWSDSEDSKMVGIKSLAGIIII